MKVFILAVGIGVGLVGCSAAPVEETSSSSADALKTSKKPLPKGSRIVSGTLVQGTRAVPAGSKQDNGDTGDTGGGGDGDATCRAGSNCEMMVTAQSPDGSTRTATCYGTYDKDCNCEYTLADCDWGDDDASGGNPGGSPGGGRIVVQPSR